MPVAEGGVTAEVMGTKRNHQRHRRGRIHRLISSSAKLMEARDHGMRGYGGALPSVVGGWVVPCDRGADKRLAPASTA
jgi:hypothetical protein